MYKHIFHTFYHQEVNQLLLRYDLLVVYKDHIFSVPNTYKQHLNFKKRAQNVSFL